MNSAAYSLLTLPGRITQALQALAEELGPGTWVLAADVADSSATATAIRLAEPQAGAIELLINNAGQADSAPLHRNSDARWRRMLTVNLSGTFHCMRAALPAMQTGGWCRIVNIASTAGQRGYAGVAACAAARHGAIGLMRSLALEVAAQGITINAVCPGCADTDLLQGSVARVVAKTGRSEGAAWAEFTRHNPQGRMVSPQEVADSVAWLWGPAAGAINGQSISVSGGEVM